MAATQDRAANKLNYSPRVVVELDGPYANLRDALDHIILYQRLCAPLLRSDQTAVVRGLIADEYARITNPDGRGICPCPHCNTPTVADPHRPGGRYCLFCNEPVCLEDGRPAETGSSGSSLA